MHFDLVLKGGEVFRFDPDSQQFRREKLEIGINGDQIQGLAATTLQGDQVVDISGLAVFPGCIDSQVHFRDPGLTHKEDLETGTKAAALGGITSVFDMPNTHPNTVTRATYDDKMKTAAEKCWVNYAFYVGAQKENLNDLWELEIDRHSPGVKIFMGSSTGNLLIDDPHILESIVAKTKRLLIIHAEDEEILKAQKALALKSKSVLDHPRWRSPEAAIKATRQIVELAVKYQKRVHILHVSSGDEAVFLTEQKKKHPGLISFEVLPQYLVLHSPECYERLGTKAQMNPPIREIEHQNALWKAVVGGVTDVLGSDHAPHTLAEKSKPYPDSPSGMPGVQTILPLMLNQAATGKISYERVCELLTEGPRRIFGCLQKGRIALGLDADLTIIDLKNKFRVEKDWLASRCGWSPFEGETLTGFPRHTLVGGKWAMRDGALQAKQGRPVTFTF